MSARQQAATDWLTWIVHEQKLSRTHLQRITGLPAADSAALLAGRVLSERQWTRVLDSHARWSDGARRHLAGAAEGAAT